jgi:hypothetical protein
MISPETSNSQEMGKIPNIQDDVEAGYVAVALEKTGVALAGSGRGSAVLGSGAFGVVVDGIWNDKRVAVKCSWKPGTSEAKGEVHAYLQSQQLAQKSGDAGRALPQVYFADVVQVDQSEVPGSEFEKPQQVGVIVMEVLHQLDAGTRQVFGSRGVDQNLYPRRGVFWPRNQELLADMVREAISSSREKFNSSRGWRMDDIWPLLPNFLTEIEASWIEKLNKAMGEYAKAGPKEVVDPWDIESRFFETLQYTEDQFIFQAESPQTGEDDDNDEVDPIETWKDVFAVIKEAASRTFAGSWTKSVRSLPQELQVSLTNYDKLHDGTENPRVQQLIRRVEILNKKFGLRVFDMHAGNVLERGRGGELVIADVGLFVFPSDRMSKE